MDWDDHQEFSIPETLDINFDDYLDPKQYFDDLFSDPEDVSNEGSFGAGGTCPSNSQTSPESSSLCETSSSSLEDSQTTTLHQYHEPLWPQESSLSDIPALLSSADLEIPFNSLTEWPIHDLLDSALIPQPESCELLFTDDYSPVPEPFHDLQLNMTPSTSEITSNTQTYTDPSVTTEQAAISKQPQRRKRMDPKDLQ